VVPLLALVLGCGPSEAEGFRAALAAPTFDEARARCQALRTTRDECVVAVVDRHAVTDRAPCDDLDDGVWRDECLFRYAERVAAAGDVAEAIDACDGHRYARECSFHLLRDAARASVDADAASATQRLAVWADALPHAPDAPRLFWRSWFRERAGAHPVDPSVCADDACLAGAREALFTILVPRAKAEGRSFCDAVPAPPPAAPTWSPGPIADAWVAQWHASECTRRRLSDRPVQP